MMQAIDSNPLKANIYARPLALLTLTLFSLNAPNPLPAETACAVTHDPSAELNLSLDSNDVSLASERFIYLGNVFDYDPATSRDEIELSIFVDPHRFASTTLRFWVHSARRGEGGAQEETLIYEEILMLTPDEVLLPDSVWFDVPFVPSIWITVPVPLSQLVPPCHDLLAIGFVVDLYDVEEKYYLPGFHRVSDPSGNEPIPVESSFFSEIDGSVKHGLSLQYLLGRFAENYMDEAEPRFKEVVETILEGSTHIRIHVRP